MLSALVFVTFLPLQVSPTGKSTLPISKPLTVAAFVDSARILGLPKLRLRDSNGNPYIKDKALLYEPSVVQEHAGMNFSREMSARKAFILSYVRGR